MRTVANSSSYPARNAKIRLVVVHTAETPCEPGRAYNIAAYLANPSIRASAHYIVDPDETVAQVPDEGTAWAAPGANADGIQIEQAAFAGFTADDWKGDNQQRMLRTQLAPLVADLCSRHGLPAVWLSADDLLAGRAGVTDHNTVNAAYGLSDHWDCGPSFPASEFIGMVNERLGGVPGVPPAADEECEMRACKMNDGQILLVDGMEFRVMPGSWDEINATLIELARAGLIPCSADGVPTLEAIGDNAVNALRKVG